MQLLVYNDANVDVRTDGNVLSKCQFHSPASDFVLAEYVKLPIFAQVTLRYSLCVCITAVCCRT